MMLFALVRIRNGEPEGWILKQSITDVRIQAESLLGREHDVVYGLKLLESDPPTTQSACTQLDQETWLIADGFS